MIYGSVNHAVLEELPADALSILDVGCGDGTFGAELKRRRNCRVVGVTHSSVEAERARRVLDEIIVADLDRSDLEIPGPFDAIVCSHVLEHLRAPAETLRRLGALLAPRGRIVIALPNALYWRQRLEFLRGRFRYTDGGIMDRSHLVFFDWETARALVADAGLDLLSARSVGGFPGSRWVRPLRPKLDELATRLAPGAFGVQFVMVARNGA